MNLSARAGILVGAMLLFVVAETAEAARQAKELLQYIPADTPYVIAFTRPLPDKLLDRMEPVMDETLSAYRTLFRTMMDEASREANTAVEEAGTAADEEHLRRIEALMDEFLGMLSVQGLRDAGIGRDSLFAVYGDGLLPVMRFALTDGDRFQATIARLEEKAGAKLDVAELRGLSYRYVNLDQKARLIIATPADDAIIAVVPAEYAETRLARTLGLDKPRNSLARSKDLKEIRKKYDFTDHVAGFVDVERIAASFLGDPSGLNAELFALLGYDHAQIDAACRAEFEELAAIAPRVVVGYTGVSTRAMEAAMIVELRDDIAAGLATLPAGVPGLGTDPGGLFSFGFSVDPLALRTFYEGRLDAMEKDPFECGSLAELQASTAKGRELLAQPVPPVVYNFRGILATVRDVTGLDISSQQPPESIDAGLLLAMENAQDIVNMAALMNPQVAALNLLPDGKARKLDLAGIGALAEQAFAALSSSGLSIAVGDRAEQQAEALLEADLASAAPFMSLSLDAKRYYQFVGDAMMQADDAGGSDVAPIEVREAMRNIMVSSSSLYERVSTDVHLTSRGIEIATRVTLSQ